MGLLPKPQAASPPAPRDAMLRPSRASSDVSLAQLHALRATPLAVQVLRYRLEEKREGALKKARFVYEIETCHQLTGDVYRAERRFREFKQLREALLLESRRCAACAAFAAQLRQTKLPARQLVVLDADKYGASRLLELTHFLRDLVALAARLALQCPKDGPDLDKSIGLFLGAGSLSAAQDAAASASRALRGAAKTRQDRIDFRGASMPEFRQSLSSLAPSDDALALIRRRGYSEGATGLGR